MRIMPSTRKTIQGRPAFIFGVTGSFDFCLAGLNLAIRGQGCYLTEVMGRRDTFSLLSMAIMLAACGGGQPSEPALPQSVSPGWTRTSLRRVGPPAGVPTSGAPQCWKAEYSGQAAPQSSADVWACWYSVSGSAFDAMQRARAAAQTVKFQEGNYLVLVNWNDAPKADLTALVRAVQKTLQE